MASEAVEQEIRNYGIQPTPILADFPQFKVKLLKWFEGSCLYISELWYDKCICWLSLQECDDLYMAGVVLEW